jgi:protein SCO1
VTSPPPERRLPSSRGTRRLAAAAALGALLAVGAGLGLWLRARPADALPVYWDVPSFALVDQRGETRTAADLAGAPWIAGFIFTRCAGVCPRMTAQMATLQTKVPTGTRLVSITVDPTHDTPEVLARYAQDFAAGPDWLFLTGTRADLYRLAVDGFKLEAMEVPKDQQKDGGDGPFLHSSKLALVDARGGVRGYYDSSDDPAMARLVADVARVSGEGR